MCPRSHWFISTIKYIFLLLGRHSPRGCRGSGLRFRPLYESQRHRALQDPVHADRRRREVLHLRVDGVDGGGWEVSSWLGDVKRRRKLEEIYSDSNERPVIIE